jgi:molecular chaperone GrpE
MTSFPDFSDDEVIEEENRVDERPDWGRVAGSGDKPGDNDEDEGGELDNVAEYAEKARAAEEKYVRALADMENLRRRCAKEVDEALKFGAASLAKDVISFIDNLERAVVFCPVSDGTTTAEVDSDESAKEADCGDDWTESAKSFAEGVRLALNSLLSGLSKHGVQKIEPKCGDSFDPSLHQAIAEVDVNDALKAGEKDGTKTEMNHVKNCSETASQARNQTQLNPGDIFDMLQAGYTMNGRLLRPAIVTVIKQ